MDRPLFSPLVVIPTYNERQSIRSLLEQLLASDRGFRVLVVDDGSPDGTGRIVAEVAASDRRVMLLQRARKDGLGAAYRAGYAQALQGDATIICQMDADLSHDPSQLEDLVDAIGQGADLAIGSRYVPGGSVRGWAWHRVVLSKGANAYVRLLTGCKIQDATAGFRAYRAQALRALNVNETTANGYAFQIEMTLRARSRGLSIQEVPIGFVERQNGRSKLSGAVAREAVYRVLRWAYVMRSGRPL